MQLPKHTDFIVSQRNVEDAKYFISSNFKFSEIEDFGYEFIQFLKLRKRVFVEGLAWNLANYDSLEFDQFDNPTSHYLVIKRPCGRVVAGTRFAPIMSDYGGLRSMSHEVFNGNLKNIPKGILSKKYLVSDNWEATRLAMDPSLTLIERKQCLSLLVLELVQAVKDQSGRGIVTLSPTSLRRLVTQNKINVTQVSNSYKCKEDMRKYASFFISTGQK